MNKNHRSEKTGKRAGPAGIPSHPPRQSAFPIQNSKFKIAKAPKASSLITTLLVLVVLSTIVIAFLQSMSIERSVSKSVKNRLQASLLADAAMDVALQRLNAITTSGPYGAVFDTDLASNPYLYLAKRYLTATNVVTSRTPLFSTFTPIGAFDSLSAKQIDTNAKTVSDRDSSGAVVSRAVTSAMDLVCNINSSNSTFPNGLVGLTNSNSLILIPVNWIYVNDSDGKVVGRYAFWMDDECSKLDLRIVGQTSNATGSHIRGNGTNVSDLSLLALTNAPLSIAADRIANLLALRNFAGFDPRSASVQYSLLTRQSLRPGEM